MDIQTITISSQSISDQLNKWQLQSLDPVGLSLATPSIPLHGVFRDDPTWDRFMDNVREYRQQVDAAEKSQE